MAFMCGGNYSTLWMMSMDIHAPENDWIEVATKHVATRADHI